VEPDRLLYGSDYPFTPSDAVGLLRELLAQTDLLDDAQRLAMFRGNALRLFPRFAQASVG
jgi:predicted TIM-barrel fold metal-dependent hydrolase